MAREIKGSRFKSMASSDDSVILEEEEKQRRTNLLDAINSLPVRQREILYLRYFQGLSFDEITHMMPYSKKTAYNLVYKAPEAIRKKC